MNKLYSIFSSETVDMVLRKSAAEQLVVVLQGEKRLDFFHLVTCIPAKSVHCEGRNSRLIRDGVNWSCELFWD